LTQLLDRASPTRVICARCSTELPPHALACPACATLVHRERLTELAAGATAAEAEGDRATARALWGEARELLPVTSAQYQQIGERLTALVEPATPLAPRRSDKKSWWVRGGGIAAAGGLLLIGKFKLLLLGLTKLSTLVSMFGFIGVYWSIHGWPLAAGLAGTIYVHEMGHVAMLRHLGIRAGAPLFIPGVGALVMLKERVTDPVLDARIGLAGPVWGLGAGVTAIAVYMFTGAPVWLAIAELTGFLNLFNLVPVWQLDGARGFAALSRRERWLIVAVVAVTLWATGVRVLWIVGAVAAYRALRGEMGPGHRASCATFAMLIAALAWLARAVG
jgi:Zn-dependent protease